MGQNINIFFIVVVIIFAAFILWGYWRGFIRVVFSLVALLVMTVLVSLLAPHMNTFLRERTPLGERVTEKCIEVIQETAQDKLENRAQEQLEGAGVSESMLPPQWSEQLAQKAAGALDEALADSGIYRQTAIYLADMILQGISFVITFLLVGIALKIAIHFLDLVARLPVLKGVNRIFGAAVGLVEGLLVVWALLFFVTLACTSQWGQQALADIQRNEFLTFLYQHNGIDYLVGRIFG